MTIEQLLNCMFPGDATKGLPSFDALRLEVSGWLEPSCEAAVLAQLRELSSEFSEKDVNIILKELKKFEPGQISVFIASALETYFSSSDVITILQNGTTTLFPNFQVVKELDPDLLLPVWERSK